MQSLTCLFDGCFFSRKLSLVRLSGLLIGCLSVLLAGVVPFNFLYMNGVLTFFEARYLGSFMFYAGLTLCLYVGLTTKFKASWRLRKQLAALGVLTFSLLFAFSLVEAPLVNALTPLPSDSGPNGSSAYKFSIPFTPYEWFIGQFRDGSYYAVNGSDWNIMTIVEPWQPVAPWAALSTNLTALTEKCLSVTSSGVIFLKQVPFDLALMESIPPNVKVACSYQDQYCEYINSADSSGSPYTVEVGAGLNNGYYIAKDSENRICFASTDVTAVMASTYEVLPLNGKIVAIGDFTVNSTISISKSNSTLDLTQSTWTMQSGLLVDTDMFDIPANSNFITITGGKLYGNKAYTRSYNGIDINQNWEDSWITVDSVYISGFRGNGIELGARRAILTNNVIEYNNLHGIFVEPAATDLYAENNLCFWNYHGFSIYGQWGRYVNNIAHYNNYHGYYVDVPSVHIYGGYTEFNTLDGIHLASSAYCTIIDSVISLKNLGNGIYIDSINNTVINNQIWDNRPIADRTQQYSIYMTENANFNTIKNNDLGNAVVALIHYGGYGNVFEDNLGEIPSRTYSIPTNAGWSATLGGTGTQTLGSMQMYVTTGVNASSSGLLYTGAVSHRATTSRLEWSFEFQRYYSDPEAKAYVQYKSVNTYGNLSAAGIGIYIENYKVYGESYGSTREIIELGTTTDLTNWGVKIVVVPNVAVEYWLRAGAEVPYQLMGVISGTAVPEATPSGYLVAAIANGATGGVNAQLYVSNINLKIGW